MTLKTAKKLIKRSHEISKKLNYYRSQTDFVRYTPIIRELVIEQNKIEKSLDSWFDEL